MMMCSVSCMHTRTHARTHALVHSLIRHPPTLSFSTACGGGYYIPHQSSMSWWLKLLLQLQLQLLLLLLLLLLFFWHFCRWRSFDSAELLSTVVWLTVNYGHNSILKAHLTCTHTHTQHTSKCIILRTTSDVCFASTSKQRGTTRKREREKAKKKYNINVEMVHCDDPYFSPFPHFLAVWRSPQACSPPFISSPHSLSACVSLKYTES